MFFDFTYCRYALKTLSCKNVIRNLNKQINVQKLDIEDRVDRVIIRTSVWWDSDEDDPNDSIKEFPGEIVELGECPGECSLLRWSWWLCFAILRVVKNEEDSSSWSDEILMFSLKSLQLFLSFLSKKETFVVFKDVRDFATSFRGRESKLLISRILSNGRERFRLTEILGAVSSHLFKNKKSNVFF